MSRCCTVTNAEVLAVDLSLTDARANRVLRLSRSANHIEAGAELHPASSVLA